MDNSFTAWRADEDAKLTGLYENNLTHAQIAQALGRSVDAIDSRRRKLGLKRDFVPRKAPPPEDFEEMAQTLNVTQLVKHYGRVKSVVTRWMYELQLTEIDTGKRKKVIPPTFCKMAPTMTCAELMRLYNTDRITVRGWLRETDITPLSKLEWQARNAKSGPIHIEQSGPVPRREFSGQTKMIAAEAAHFLRRTHPSVHRADIRMYEQSSHTWGDVKNIPYRGVNQYYVSGKGVMWIDDLIAYAGTKGFTIKELT